MKGRGGYSLFEVLIAFVIMTLVLSALIPGQARLLARATVQEPQLLAHDYALSRAAALGVVAPLELGITEETYRDWRVMIAVTQGDTIRAEAATLIVSIAIDDQQGRRLATLETLRAAQ